MIPPSRVTVGKLVRQAYNGLVWQPSRAAWRLIWAIAALVVLAWPPDQDRSLGVKAVNWLADPLNTLPTLPPPLPIGQDDDADAVTTHDMQEAEYNRVSTSSQLARIRLRLKELQDPFNPSTERQLLIGMGVLGGLVVWKLSADKSSGS